MNHYEQLKAMFESSGIQISDELEDSMRVIRIEVKGEKPDGEKPEGYLGFATWFYFNQDGSLNKVGIWE